MKIVVGIPCYNCEGQISRALTEIDSVLAQNPQIEAVYIIDNQSPDATIQNAINSIKTLQHRSLFSVYRNVTNVGLGGTHKVAFNLAKQNNFSHLMIFHGDHQASAFDITNLLAESKLSFNITTLGARFINLSLLNGYSAIRIVGNIGLNFLYTLATFKKIYDLGSGLNLFRIQDFDFDEVKYFDNGFTFNMDLLLNIIERKIEFKYVPISWSTTDQISNAHALKVGIKTLIKLLNWLINKKAKSSANYQTELIFSG